jgi:hypothetical protein
LASFNWWYNDTYFLRQIPQYQLFKLTIFFSKTNPAGFKYKPFFGAIAAFYKRQAVYKKKIAPCSGRRFSQFVMDF